MKHFKIASFFKNIPELHILFGNKITLLRNLAIYCLIFNILSVRMFFATRYFPLKKIKSNPTAF